MYVCFVTVEFNLEIGCVKLISSSVVLSECSVVDEIFFVRSYNTIIPISSLKLIELETSHFIGISLKWIPTIKVANHSK